MHTVTTDIPLFLVAPFILLLSMLATGPVLYPTFWHRYYNIIAIVLSLLVVGYYILVLHDIEQPIEALADYIQFISVLVALYMVSSNILIDIKQDATPATNLILLWGGAIIANIIGTTGASMLLIRPYMRLNGKNLQAYHIVFFILMVSNVGGCLTPIGDPPLFLGFLKGVPFFWTLRNCFVPWLTAMSSLSIMFYFKDKSIDKKSTTKIVKRGISIIGKRNFMWLSIIVAAIFIDPRIVSCLPVIVYHGHRYSFLRESLLLIITILTYQRADQAILQKNGFSLAPIKEVMFIFIGIFGTMIPAMTLITKLATSPSGQAMVHPNTLYWTTGLLSSMLDNAPTYLCFLKSGMASQGQDISTYVIKSALQLKAISIGAVFCGGGTYVGNGPNFMVKAIAQEHGVKMPSFVDYIVHYSLPYLFPTLMLVWTLFFALRG